MALELVGDDPSEAFVVEILTSATDDREGLGKSIGCQKRSQCGEKETSGQVAGRAEQDESVERCGHPATSRVG